MDFSWLAGLCVGCRVSGLIHHLPKSPLRWAAPPPPLLPTEDPRRHWLDFTGVSYTSVKLVGLQQRLDQRQGVSPGAETSLSVQQAASPRAGMLEEEEEESLSLDCLGEGRKAASHQRERLKGPSQSMGRRHP